MLVHSTGEDELKESSFGLNVDKTKKMLKKKIGPEKPAWGPFLLIVGDLQLP